MSSQSDQKSSGEYQFSSSAQKHIQPTHAYQDRYIQPEAAASQEYPQMSEQTQNGYQPLAENPEFQQSSAAFKDGDRAYSFPAPAPFQESVESQTGQQGNFGGPPNVYYHMQPYVEEPRQYPQTAEQENYSVPTGQPNSSFQQQPSDGSGSLQRQRSSLPSYGAQVGDRYLAAPPQDTDNDNEDDSSYPSFGSRQSSKSNDNQYLY
ncbi:unnamed protein product [Soboliphyme baturini]|uniref:Similar to n=1 Tax=Soboliphyme baturini TaxID=241478 RepID=A0A183IFA1_9BILA|nr:unnamed protein product [Soboliphyme baturini]